jgi:FkbM family methyltransferase
LCRNIEANGFENVVAAPKAVCDQSGRTTLTILHVYLAESRLGELGHGNRIQVETICLDEFLVDYVDKVHFVKIDIEGAEPAALEGMKTILASNPELIPLPCRCPGS